jgi:hypothetical protein
MAEINPEYKNRINTIAMGIQHNVQLYTRYPLTPGDGTRGNLINQTMYGAPDLGEGEVFTPHGSGSFNP